MNFYQKKINQIKIALGVDVEMTEAVLKDGVTKVMADALEPGNKLYVVSETGEQAPAPEGIHQLEDGTEIHVDADGIITLVEAPEIVVDMEEVPAGEKPAGQATKTESEATINSEMAKFMDQKIGEAMDKVYMAIEEVAKEIGSVKEQMAAYNSKMEQMTKTPGSSKISTFNNEISTPTNMMEARLEGLKNLREEFASRNKRF